MNLTATILHRAASFPVDTTFSYTDFADLADDREVLYRQLSKLNKRGDITRVRPGQYAYTAEAEAPAFSEPLSKRLIERIHALGPNELFTSATFTDLSTQKNISTILNRLRTRSQITRVSHGYYVQSGSTVHPDTLPSITERIRRHIAALTRPDQTISVSDFDSLASARSVQAILNALERNGTLTRVGRGQYRPRNALTPVPASYVSIAEQIRRVIERDLTPGQLFTTATFLSIAPRKIITPYLIRLIDTGVIDRVSKGAYIKAVPDATASDPVRAVPSVFQLVKLRTAELPADVPFSLHDLGISARHSTISYALVALTGQGVIERIARGVYIRRSSNRH